MAGGLTDLSMLINGMACKSRPKDATFERRNPLGRHCGHARPPWGGRCGDGRGSRRRGLQDLEPDRPRRRAARCC